MPWGFDMDRGMHSDKSQNCLLRVRSLAEMYLHWRLRSAMHLTFQICNQYLPTRASIVSAIRALAFPGPTRLREATARGTTKASTARLQRVWGHMTDVHLAGTGRQTFRCVLNASLPQGTVTAVHRWVIAHRVYLAPAGCTILQVQPPRRFCPWQF